LVFDPFLTTLIRTFIGFVSLVANAVVDRCGRGYLLAVSGGTSMTHGHTLATGFVDALLTTLMLSFMTVSPRISVAACG